MPATLREEDVIKALREAHDPEIPNIVDLGLF
jgi:metal-sulfur cluster biosynthetic enzyme